MLFTEVRYIMKYFISVICILIVVIACCYFWYQWDVSSFKNSISDDNTTISSEKNNDREVFVGENLYDNVGNKVKELGSKVRLYNENEFTDNSGAAVEDNIESEIQVINNYKGKRSSENQLVSPFGFGPYPEVPDDYPYENPWIMDGLTSRESKISELLERVRIKLWNQGSRPEGISWEDGLIYPIYPNTIYVDWDYSENDDGVIERYPSHITSGTLTDEQNLLLDEGIIPPGVIVYEHNEVGIDPYEFLNLK